MLKVVAFDFDGVIANTFDLAISVCRENGKKITRSQYKSHHDGNVFEEPAIVFSEEDTENFYTKRLARAHRCHLFPVRKEIRRLAKKYHLVVISSTREKLIQKYLFLGKMSEYFKDILGKETHKSKVEKFKQIFKKYGIAPQNCVFVTDTLGDLREAKTAGVPTIAVTWGYHGKTRLKKGKPDLMVHDFDELMPAIDIFRE